MAAKKKTKTKINKLVSAKIDKVAEINKFDSGEINKFVSAKIDKVAEIKKIAEELLKLMGSKATVVVSEDKENDAVVIDIETEDEAGLLIGNRGDTLNSFQSIIGMLFRQKTGDWQRILVNISDWRERQEERLVSLAHQTAERAKETSEPQTLYNLSASERRVVHLTLSQDELIETESQGEGKERYLVVRLKKN